MDGTSRIRTWSPVPLRTRGAVGDIGVDLLVWHTAEEATL